LTLLDGIRKSIHPVKSYYHSSNTESFPYPILWCAWRSAKAGCFNISRKTELIWYGALQQSTLGQQLWSFFSVTRKYCMGQWQSKVMTIWHTQHTTAYACSYAAGC